MTDGVTDGVIDGVTDGVTDSFPSSFSLSIVSYPFILCLSGFTFFTWGFYLISFLPSLFTLVLFLQVSVTVADRTRTVIAATHSG